MPTLVVDEPDFRIVHDVIDGQDIFIMEKRKGCNAMGDPHWEPVKAENAPILKMLFRYILKISTGEIK